MDTLKGVSDDPRDADVVIIGGSIGAMMMAAQLRHRMPDLHVLVVGRSPDQEKRPIVGESLLEPPTVFFHRIGIGKYLDREHTVKQGLSFYYKLANGDDRHYTVHSPELLHVLSRQLHRPRFDQDLRSHLQRQGVEFLDGLAEDIEIGGDSSRHRLTVRAANRHFTLTSRWVVDATGRNRWLGRRVTTYTRPATRQRNVFWFRLANFEPFSRHIKVSMRRPLKYTLWDTTHHFMGRGYWVWCIPLHSPEHDSMISIGLTYRPDLFTQQMKSIDDFLTLADREHPALADMVRSGTVVDTQTYGNFLHWADRIYSADGWFLTADAARTVDPLYSTGLTMNVVQIEQIAEIISRQREGEITAKEIDSLQSLWQVMAYQIQEDITTLYEGMHDPFQACMRRYWSNITYFNLLLPMWHNGVFYDTDAAPFLRRLFARGPSIQAAVNKFFAKVSRRLGDQLTQEAYDRAVDFDWLLNPHWDCPPDDIAHHFSRVFYKRAALRWKLSKMTNLRYSLGQFPEMGLELLASYVMPMVLHQSAPRVFPRTKRRAIHAPKSHGSHYSG